MSSPAGVSKFEVNRGIFLQQEGQIAAEPVAQTGAVPLQKERDLITQLQQHGRPPIQTKDYLAKLKEVVEDGTDRRVVFSSSLNPART